MTKELEKIKGCNVNRQYPANDKALDIFLKVLADKDPIKKVYYECVDKKGRTTFISENKTLVLSVAGRFGYDYRTVEYEESFEAVDEK